MSDLKAKLREQAQRIFESSDPVHDDYSDTVEMRVEWQAADEIDRLTGEVSRRLSERNEVMRLAEDLRRKADALAEAVLNTKYFTHKPGGDELKNIEISRQDWDAIKAALTAYQNKEIIQGEVGKEIVG